MRLGHMFGVMIYEMEALHTQLDVLRAGQRCKFFSRIVQTHISFSFICLLVVLVWLLWGDFILSFAFCAAVVPGSLKELWKSR